MKDLNFSVKTIEEIMDEWMDEAKIATNRKVAVHVHHRKVFVITDVPGAFIGFEGRLVKKYQKILRANGFGQNVKFIDISRGGLKVF